MAKRVLLISYLDRDSVIHRLTGATKLLTFFLWSITAMTSYDTRLLLVLVLAALTLFKVSKVNLKDVRIILTLIGIFLFINLILIYLFSPQEGVRIYQSRTIIWAGIGRYNLTQEQLFYMFNIMIKYLAIIPISLLFVVTTHPSEFASSLNRIGLSYRISYAVSIALRYITTIQENFWTIWQVQQARGMASTKKESLWRRIQGITYVIFPLIFSSLSKIDVISNAMLLRGFGKHKRRSWYHDRCLGRHDYIALTLGVLLVIINIALFYLNNGRFYSPF